MSLLQTVPTSGGFSPLFCLLDDYNAHHSSDDQTLSLSSFTPCFDFHESDGACLPSWRWTARHSSESIDIEFSDHETLVIKGCSEHKFHTSDTPQGKGTGVTKMGDQFVTKANNNKHCYWLSERSVGEFHRTFAFPGYVDQDEVKASLKDGILSLVVPKVTTSGTKKINTK